MQYLISLDFSCVPFKNLDIMAQKSLSVEIVLILITPLCLQGFSSANGDQFRTDYVITPDFDGPEQTLTYYVEMASSRILGTTNGDEIGEQHICSFITGLTRNENFDRLKKLLRKFSGLQ
jgi:hypothetical protein